MGRRGGKRGGRGGGRGGNRGGQRADYTAIERHNERFEQYYNDLHVVPDEEREAFWAAMRRDLPNSFRFTGSKGHALAVQERLRDYYVPNITSITYEGKPVDPPQPVPWYPDQLAWSMTTPKNVVRRFAPFAAFQKFLVAETEVGNISRQEIVSMIPPLLLDVRPGMAVLDMCAAPGSKSCQLMEMVHAGEEERLHKITAALEQDEAARKNGTLDIAAVAGSLAGFEDDGRPTGLLIANDSDYKRAHLLIHQMKRLNSPNLIVTNHDATIYPSIRLPRRPDENPRAPVRYLKFDRILADVPCSGDGTPRKNIRVWKDWGPGNALGLHNIQSRILTRALQMLKVGGRVVYSTCSMNPVENESVVASVIERCGGAEKVRIVDCSNELVGLKRSPGLRQWAVMDKTGATWKSYEDVRKALEDGNDAVAKLLPSMFPPAVSDSAAVDPDFDLSRCMRVYPHQQDTGGFFITVLEKKAEIKAKDASQATANVASKRGPDESTPTAADEGGVVKKAKVDAEAGEEGVTPAVQAEEVDAASEIEAGVGAAAAEESQTADIADTESTPTPVAAPIAVSTSTHPVSAETTSAQIPTATAAAIAADRPPPKRRPGQPTEEPFKYIDASHPDFQQVFSFYDISPQFPRDRFMVRNSEGRPAKTVYYTSALARDILTENEGAGIKFVHCGVKMFVKQDVQAPEVCPWRIQTDGLQICNPWVGTGRVVKLTRKETLRKLLIEMFPKVHDDGWKELGEIGEWARDASMGCCVLRVEPSGQPDGLTERMVLPLWRSKHSLNLMLPKEERRAMLLRLFDDDTPLVNTTLKRDEAAAGAAAEESPAAAAAVEAAQEESDALKAEEPAE
ncbi:hypothetical protein KEM52_003630 [Ascosphaera acerosa]|nr:hypothetical protein KEM52_003630 [Ascosphaera acerosa]